MTRWVRIVAGLVVLAGLAVISARLLPVYWANYRFEHYLKRLSVDGNLPEDLLRIAVVNQASRLGLPVRGDQVRLSRAGGRLRIEVRYAVPVDLLLYSVDLHFRPVRQ